MLWEPGCPLNQLDQALIFGAELSRCALLITLLITLLISCLANLASSSQWPSHKDETGACYLHGVRFVFGVLESDVSPF